MFFLFFNSSGVFAACDIYEYGGSLSSCSQYNNAQTYCFAQGNIVKYVFCSSPLPTCNSSQILDPYTQTCVTNPALVPTCNSSQVLDTNTNTCVAKPTTPTTPTTTPTTTPSSSSHVPTSLSSAFASLVTDVLALINSAWGAAILIIVSFLVLRLFKRAANSAA